MVLLDCWSGQIAVGDINQAEIDDIQFQYIPTGTTEIAQPLDVYFFRIHKTFLRHLSSAVKLSEQ